MNRFILHCSCIFFSRATSNNKRINFSNILIYCVSSLVPKLIVLENVIKRVREKEKPQNNTTFMNKNANNTEQFMQSIKLMVVHQQCRAFGEILKARMNPILSNQIKHAILKSRGMFFFNKQKHNGVWYQERQMKGA